LHAGSDNTLQSFVVNSAEPSNPKSVAFDKVAMLAWLESASIDEKPSSSLGNPQLAMLYWPNSAPTTKFTSFVYRSTTNSKVRDISMDFVASGLLIATTVVDTEPGEEEALLNGQELADSARIELNQDHDTTVSNRTGNDESQAQGSLAPSMDANAFKFDSGTSESVLEISTDNSDSDSLSTILWVAGGIVLKHFLGWIGVAAYGAFTAAIVTLLQK
jgi:hypothetical protein